MTDTPIDAISGFLVGWDAGPYLAGETVVCGGIGGGPNLTVDVLRGAVAERNFWRQHARAAETKVGAMLGERGVNVADAVAVLDAKYGHSDGSVT